MPCLFRVFLICETTIFSLFIQFNYFPLIDSGPTLATVLIDLLDPLEFSPARLKLKCKFYKHKIKIRIGGLQNGTRNIPRGIEMVSMCTGLLGEEGRVNISVDTRL